MKKITDKEILDDLIKQLDCKNAEEGGKSYASYEDMDNDIYIEASVKWDLGWSENWINIDGHHYLEGTYTDVYGFDDLQVDAWIGDKKAEVDIDYIEQNLY